MHKDLSQGAIGRVLLDRNNAFYFLDKFDLKENRDVRMIRDIDYAIEYHLARVKHDVTPPSTRSPNETNYSEEERFMRKAKLSQCGEALTALSENMVAVSQDTAKEQLIPAEVRLSVSFFINHPLILSCAVQEEVQCNFA